MIPKFTKVLLIALGPFAVCQSFAAIMSEEERLAKIEMGKALLKVEVRPLEEELLSKASSPFTADLGNVQEEVKVETEVVALSDEELLPILAASIEPTGIFQFAGEDYLIFNEKKMKAGSEYGVRYRGTEYSVRIANITRSTFTVQLGEARLQLKLK